MGDAADKPVGVLGRLGVFVVRRRRLVLVSAVVVTLLFAVGAAGAMGSMVLSRWEVPGAESSRAQDALIERFGTGNANMVLLVTALTGTVDRPDVVAAGNELAGQLAAERSVGAVWSYWSQDRDPTLRSSEHARQAVVLAWVKGNATEARAQISDLIAGYTGQNATIRVQVTGTEAASSQVSALATSDFGRAELIIIPLMLLLMILVYRRLSPALLTLGVALFAVIGSLTALRALAQATEVSSFAANLTLVMGVGLGIDYSLFVIARYQEEFARGATVGDAVVHAVRTAGRTVVFSGLIVAGALSALLVFPLPFLRSFAYAGVLVVIMAVLGALVFLPAALAALGRRVAGRGTAGHGPGGDEGFWYRFGNRVMRRPVVFGGLALIVLLALTWPALGIRIGLPDDRVLPPTASTRQAYDEIRANFSVEAHDAIQLIAPAGGAVADVANYGRRLSEMPGIAQVNSAAGDYTNGQLVRAPGPGSTRLTSDPGTRLEAIPTREALSGDVDELMANLRAVPAPFDDVLVGGYPAQLSDLRTVLTERLPVAVLLILLISFAVLFLLSGSLVIPAKAILLNLLSVSAMFGALVFVFQNGNFATLLGFTPIGTLDPAFPILMFCVVYGLSMDYEVLLLSRIKEEHDIGQDNTRAVLSGLRRGAPLITTAALILALSFSVYATGQVMYLQMIGVGTALAIFVDATVIRAVLVPAVMGLAGQANWWAPPPLRRLHQRIGLREVTSRAPLSAPDHLAVRDR